jgi:hypothetical protein
VNGLVLTQARFEPSQFCSPVRASAGCRVGYFDHGGTDITAASFGDMSCVMGLAAVVDPSSQASVADQVLAELDRILAAAEREAKRMA